MISPLSIVATVLLCTTKSTIGLPAGSGSSSPHPQHEAHQGVASGSSQHTSNPVSAVTIAEPWWQTAADGRDTHHAAAASHGEIAPATTTNTNTQQRPRNRVIIRSNPLSRQARQRKAALLASGVPIPPVMPETERELPFKYSITNPQTSETKELILEPKKEKMATIDAKRKERVAQGLLHPVEYNRMKENEAIVAHAHKRLRMERTAAIQDVHGNIMHSSALSQSQALLLHQGDWLDQVKDALGGRLEYKQAGAAHLHQKDIKERQNPTLWYRQDVRKKGKRRGYNPITKKWEEFQTMILKKEKRQRRNRDMTPPPELDPPSSPERHSELSLTTKAKGKKIAADGKKNSKKTMELFPDLLKDVPRASRSRGKRVKGSPKASEQEAASSNPPSSPDQDEDQGKTWHPYAPAPSAPAPSAPRPDIKAGMSRYERKKELLKARRAQIMAMDLDRGIRIHEREGFFAERRRRRRSPLFLSKGKGKAIVIAPEPESSDSSSWGD